MKWSRVMMLFSFGSTVLYVGSYLLTVEAAVEKVAHASHFAPHYRIGGKVAEQIYSPLHHLDTQLRTKYWQAQ